MKTEYGWVIKRDDKKYLRQDFETWSMSIFHSEFFPRFEYADATIYNFNLKDCKPVKIEIREVGE